MPCFTGSVFPGKSESGDTILKYALNPTDKEKFRKMYGEHSLTGPVQLKNDVKGSPYPVRVSSRSLPNPSSALPHVCHALSKGHGVLPLTVNFISPGRITKQSTILRSGHSMTPALCLYRQHHWAAPQMYLLTTSWRSISLLSLHKMKSAMVD